MQAIMLRRQHLTQKIMTFIGQLQVQTTAIIVAFAALNPAALFQLIGDARGVGAR